MNKVKIIDLLNKIANGEEAPKKIKYKDIEYEYNEKSYIDGFDDDLFVNVYCNEIDLNEEVEIIEEDIKENPTFEEYMENPEKYWNNLLEKLDEIKQYLKND